MKVGGYNPQVAEFELNQNDTYYRDKSGLMNVGSRKNEKKNYLEPVSKMTLKVWPGVPSSIGP